MTKMVISIPYQPGSSARMMSCCVLETPPAMDVQVKMFAFQEVTITWVTSVKVSALRSVKKIIYIAKHTKFIYNIFRIVMLSHVFFF